MRRPAKRLALAGVAALAAACGSVPATHYYVLAPPMAAAGAAGAPAAGGVRLGVETFAVDPPYDQDRLVYRVGRDSPEVGFYHHHRWSAPPGRLVATALAAGLAGTPGVAGVEPARVNGRYSHLLAGRVVALEEVDLPGRQVARIQLDVELVDPTDGSVIWTRFVTAELEGRAEDAADVVRQMQAAFAEAVATVRADLDRILKRLN
jgi:ABC-type uncharacterized transport system auxiliary subunit